MKKFLRVNCLMPLIIFLLTFIYGLLQFDAADGPEKVSYGWLYALFFIWIFLLLYLASAVGNLINLLKEYKQSKSPRQQFYYWAYVSAFVQLLIYGGIGMFDQVLVPYSTMGDPLTLAFGMASLLTAIFGWLEKSGDNPQSEPVTFQRSRLIGGLLFPGVVVLVTVGIRMIFN